jgi:PAS domain S-box-containing protein
VAVYATDAGGRITYYNQAAVDFWGHRPQIGTDQWCGSWRLYWPDGRPLPHDECPMALTLKERRPVRGMEAVAERPDGTRVPFMPYPTPLFDAQGELVGAINLLMDTTEPHQAALDSARLAAIVVSSDDAIVSKTLEGRVTSWNDGAARIFGYQPDEMIGQPVTKLIPPDLLGEEDEIIAKLRRGERVNHFETERLTKDGRRINVSVTVSPLHDKTGRVVGASKVARDITERKQSEKIQRLLLDELNHRVKNTLATVQAIARQSLYRSKSPDEFVASFSGRVQAMARAHGVLTQRALQGAEISDLVREQVLLDSSSDSRITCSGPGLILDSQSALHLALVLHELATNARKYGALSVPHGRLTVTWSLLRKGGRTLLMRWNERGGPRVVAPSAAGFGTTLIEQALGAHGGTASIHYEEGGVSCDITLPLAAEVSAQSIAAPDAEREPRPATRAATNQSALSGKRILVVEDEALLSMDLEASLVAAGCEVIGPAATLETARPLIEAGCDAALLDVNLAGYPVDELAAALAERKIPFAFLTGYGREALPDGFRDAPMLGKPFSQRDVLAIVARLLAPNVVQLKQKAV